MTLTAEQKLSLECVVEVNSILIVINGGEENFIKYSADLFPHTEREFDDAFEKFTLSFVRDIFDPAVNPTEYLSNWMLNNKDLVKQDIEEKATVVRNYMDDDFDKIRAEFIYYYSLLFGCASFIKNYKSGIPLKPYLMMLFVKLSDTLESMAKSVNVENLIKFYLYFFRMRQAAIEAKECLENHSASTYSDIFNNIQIIDAGTENLAVNLVNKYSHDNSFKQKFLGTMNTHRPRIIKQFVQDHSNHFKNGISQQEIEESLMNSIEGIKKNLIQRMFR